MTRTTIDIATDRTYFFKDKNTKIEYYCMKISESTVRIRTIDSDYPDENLKLYGNFFGIYDDKRELVGEMSLIKIHDIVCIQLNTLLSEIYTWDDYHYIH